jgi:hypothetical protein
MGIGDHPYLYPDDPRTAPDDYNEMKQKDKEYLATSARVRFGLTFRISEVRMTLKNTCRS